MNLGKCCSDGKSVFCADFSVKYIRTHSALFFIRYGLRVKNGGDFDERGKQRTGICPWILLFSTLRSIAAAFTRAYVLYGVRTVCAVWSGGSLVGSSCSHSVCTDVCARD